MSTMNEFSMCSSLIKVNDSAMGIQILSSAGTGFLENFSLQAIAYDMNQAIYLSGAEGVVFTTVGDIIEFILENMGAGMDYLGIEITKEEFYRIPDTSHDGAYIQHIDGTLYTADQWTNGGFSNDVANGVAVINGLRGVSLVVAKDKFDSMPWSSISDTLIEGIFTTTDLYVEHMSANFGVEPTAIIAAADPNSVAAACMNYTFPNGQKGYLPSCYEARWGAVEFEETFKNLMSLIGRNDFGDVNEEYMWTSTQCDAERAWTQRYYGINREQSTGRKDFSNSFYPVCALENYKFPTA